MGDGHEPIAKDYLNYCFNYDGSRLRPVQPWERGNLAKPQMALDPYPLQSALRAHNYGSREAAAGGNAAQGGGCGCY